MDNAYADNLTYGADGGCDIIATKEISGISYMILKP